MLQQTKEAILKTLSKKKSMSELEVSTTMKTNFSFIEPSVTELKNEGLVAEVGLKYSDSLGKLFRVITVELPNAEKMKAQIEKRQYAAQKKAVCVKLLNDLDEFKNRTFLSESLTLLRQSPQKISKKYFHLNNDDIISIYENILLKGWGALKDYEAKVATPLT